MHMRSLTRVAGIFLGFCANVIVKDVPRIAWRLQLGSAFIPSLVLAVGIFFCPESPRWLMKHGKFAKGFQSMCKLRAHPIIAARDYYYSHVLYVEELRIAKGAGYFSRLADCFRIPRIRRANYGASTVMIAQQMCGINSKTRIHRCILAQSAPANLVRLSHLILQLHHLHQCWLHGNTSALRLSRLWSCASHLHHPDIVPHRHQGAANANTDCECFTPEPRFAHRNTNECHRHSRLCACSCWPPDYRSSESQSQLWPEKP
jgi:hypothetical protein